MGRKGSIREGNRNAPGGDDRGDPSDDEVWRDRNQ